MGSTFLSQITYTPVRIFLSGFLLFIVTLTCKCKSFENDSIRIAAIIKQGEEMQSHQEFEKASLIFEKLIAEDLDKLSASQRTMVYNMLGDGYFVLFKYEKALENYLKNLKDNSEESLVKAGIEYRLGRLYARLHDYDTARDYFSSSEKVFQANNHVFQYSIKMALGNVYLETKDYSDAIEVYDEIKEYFLSPDQSFLLADLYSNWALAIAGLERYIESDSIYQLALAKYKELKFRPGISATYHNLGLSRLNRGEYLGAVEYFRLALDFADQDFLGNYRKALYGLGRAESRIGNCVKGNAYLIEYDSLHNIYLNEEKNQEIVRLDVIHRVAEYRRNSLLQEAKLDRQRRGKSYVLLASCFIVIVFLVYLYISEQRKKALKAIGEKNQQIANQKINDLLKQREIVSLQGVLAGQETERNRIAADLHDKLGAILGMVKLHFSAVEERIDSLKEDNKLQYEKANALLDQATEEVRNISHNLISGVLTKFGLVPALNDLRNTIESTGKLRMNLSVSDLENRLDGEKELQIYRIIQELLSNILKHSQATEADIQLTRNNGNLNLMVHDNGVGFDPKAARSKKGIGMQNLLARVEQLNGTLNYDSGKGAGTTVNIDIPLGNNNY